MDARPLSLVGGLGQAVTAKQRTRVVARRVAEVLRHCFATTEQRSHPADAEGGNRLELTVDTTRAAEPARQNRHGPGWRPAAPRARTAAGSEGISGSGPFGLFGE